MRIGIVGAYPPFKGPRCSRTFWSARALAEAGHEVCVITDALDAPAHSSMWIENSEKERLTAAGIDMRLASVAESKCHSEPSRVTLLAAETARVARRRDFDALLAFSIEPYGLAVGLASAWTDTPYIVGPTRSERSVLLGDLAAGEAAREVLRHAAVVMTDSAESIELLGVREHRIAREPPPPIDPRFFHPKSNPLDLGPHIRNLSRDWDEVRPDSQPPFDVPLLGLMGAVGHHNSSFDLLEALEILKRNGISVNVLASIGGPVMRDFMRVAGLHGLVKNLWRIPYLPPWKVPAFLARCSIVFCAGTSPGRSTKLSEVLACGRHAVATSEAATSHPVRLPTEVCTVISPGAKPSALADGLSVALQMASNADADNGATNYAEGAGLSTTAEYLEPLIRRASDDSGRRVLGNGTNPKSRGRIKRWLPLHAALYESHAREIELKMVSNDSLSLADGLEELLERTEEFDALEQECLQPLLTYERLLLWARSGRGHDDEAQADSSKLIERRRPRTRPTNEYRPRKRGIRILEAIFDVPAAYREAVDSIIDRQGIESITSRLPRRNCNVVVIKRSDRLPSVMDVPDSVLSALERCDGVRSLREILDGVEVDSRAAVEQALSFMVLEGGLDLK